MQYRCLSEPALHWGVAEPGGLGQVVVDDRLEFAHLGESFFDEVGAPAAVLGPVGDPDDPVDAPADELALASRRRRAPCGCSAVPRREARPYERRENSATRCSGVAMRTGPIWLIE